MTGVGWGLVGNPGGGANVPGFLRMRSKAEEKMVEEKMVEADLR